MLDFIKAIYYEFLSNFVPQRVNYRLEGQCKACGDCCRKIYCVDTYSVTDFELLKKIAPKYKRFKVAEIDENGFIVLSCTLLGSDGKCSDYKNRLGLCKRYPHNVDRFLNPKLHDRCGFRIVSDEKFSDYLTVDNGEDSNIK